MRMSIMDFSEFNPQFLLESDRNICHLTDHLSQVFATESWSDVVLICSDMLLNANRCVLAATSQFFYSIFKEQPRDEIYVSFKDYR